MPVGARRIRDQDAGLEPGPDVLAHPDEFQSRPSRLRWRSLVHAPPGIPSVPATIKRINTLLTNLKLHNGRSGQWRRLDAFPTGALEAG